MPEKRIIPATHQKQAFLFGVLLLWGLAAMSQSIDSQTNDCKVAIQNIMVDVCQKSISFPARINQSKGIIEVVVATPSGKTHESIFVADIDPLAFEAALLMMGCVKTKGYAVHMSNPDKIASLKHRKKTPDQLIIQVVYTDSTGSHTDAVESFIWDQLREQDLQPGLWHFKGIPLDETGIPYPHAGNNLVVSFIEPDAILEMDSPRLFNDNYFFAHEQKIKSVVHKEITIIISRPEKAIPKKQ